MFHLGGGAGETLLLVTHFSVNHPPKESISKPQTLLKREHQVAEARCVRGRQGPAGGSPAYTCCRSAHAGHGLLLAVQCPSVRSFHLIKAPPTSEQRTSSAVGGNRRIHPITATPCLPPPNVSAGPTFSAPHGTAMADPHPT